MKSLKINQRLLFAITLGFIFLMSGCDTISSISPFAESEDVLSIVDNEDADRTSELMSTWGVTGVPAIVYVENGEVVISRNGLMNDGELSIFFETHQ